MIIHFAFLLVSLFNSNFGAVVAPPWADPILNPCALLPRGWQMLYWPPDGKCYKIFKMGYPCPATMELTPAIVGSNSGATCRCPPKTLRTSNSNICYPMYTKGPCTSGEYFAPNPTKQGIEYKLGKCLKPTTCPDPTQIFWPNDGRCYRRLSKGPCPFGKLINMGADSIANCTCDINGDYSWEEESSKCFDHYTKGPCRPGELFLPGGKCGCSPELPHYYHITKSCYEIGSIGPCNTGHRFILSSDSPNKAKCTCKSNYALWNDNSCYRLYTRGPCGSKELFAPPSRCVPLPCRRSRLYFPDEKRCYKIGSQGPCKAGQVVIFDFEARPSIDGIAFNGICGCADALSIEKPNGCTTEDMSDSHCKSMPYNRIVGDMCHMLYTKGPCKDGQWLVPKHGANSTDAECACKPGYIESQDVVGNGCLPPTVALAKYLNENSKLIDLSLKISS